MSGRNKSQTLSRREFFQFLTGSSFSMVYAYRILPPPPSPDAIWVLDSLPVPEKSLAPLAYMHPASIDPAGYLNLEMTVGGTTLPGRVELLDTEWVRKRFNQWYRLNTDYPWAIVLHWDGGPNQPRTLDRLVNGLNHSEDIVTRAEMENSAHFGIGPNPPYVSRGNPNSVLSIAQLQRPWLDGTPLIASHLRHHVGHPDHRQGTPEQVLKVMQTLGIESTLVDIHTGARFDPNFRTLAVEIAGKEFDDDFPDALPGAQQIGNLLTLLRALMLAYSLRAWDIVGHFELQGDKPDPGKLFMAQVRFLVGVQALQNPGRALRLLTFGQYRTASELIHAATGYFGQLREFTKRLTTPKQFQAWDHFTGCQCLIAYLQDLDSRLLNRRGDRRWS